jgi:MerR family mercuric resistance operon transcriptional regulator
MRIGELAKTAGVGVETVRYYQRIGLLGTPAKPYGGARNYTDDHLARLRFIRRAQQLGFSLNDINALLRLSSADCEDVQALARRKLELIQGKITDLNRMAAVLEDVLARCATRRKHQGCPIIESLAGGNKGSR